MHAAIARATQGTPFPDLVPKSSGDLAHAYAMTILLWILPHRLSAGTAASNGVAKIRTSASEAADKGVTFVVDDCRGFRRMAHRKAHLVLGGEPLAERLADIFMKKIPFPHSSRRESQVCLHLSLMRNYLQMLTSTAHEIGIAPQSLLLPAVSDAGQRGAKLD